MRSEIDIAIDTWIEKLRAPQTAHTSIRARFKRLRMSPQEIYNDLEAKLAREGK